MTSEPGVEGIALRCRVDSISGRERPMSLSVASNAAGYGKPLGYGLAGLSLVATPIAAAPQRSSTASSWSWTPPSTGSARRVAGLSSLMAVLSQVPAADPATAGRTGPARSDAADLLQALNAQGATPAAPALLSSKEGSPKLDRLPAQELVQTATTGSLSALPADASIQDASGDPSISTAEAQLEALFKTLQAYGL